jgi:hypothetical protein
MNSYDPTTPQITFGPYNHEQAPSIECANCGTPITVGQEAVPLAKYVIGWDWQNGVLVPVVSADFAAEFKTTPWVHADCSAQFSHDHISKDTCGNEDEEFYPRECQCCGARLDPDSEE